MNVTGAQDTRLSLETWNEPEMKRALADRDISSVYRLLRRVGISQRYIAALTGQSQSEISEILKGRQVMAYDVLVRIAGGLGIPRGYMGLAYDPATATSMVGPPDDAQAEEDESVKRRNLLAHGTAMMFGTTVLGANRGQWLPSPAQTPTPSQIGMADVRQIEATTRAMIALDTQYGGGMCRDAVIAQLSWAQRLLSASCKDEVRPRLFRALGDLQNIAGWTSYDVGLVESARSHYATALEFANQADDQNLMASIMYKVGQIYLLQRDANEALKWFQMGQLAAQNCGSERAASLMCVNEAVAYSILKDEAQAKKLLDRAESELARAAPLDGITWPMFHDTTALYAAIARVHSELAAVEPRNAATAISAGHQALSGYDDFHARGRAATLGDLAISYVRNGDVKQGIQVGHKALLAASTVQSVQLPIRIKPLQAALTRLPNRSSDSRELCHLIAARQNV
ncbi:MAG TPA: helix-turn-helix transcriptional regulator [Pseudonocardiaceae bacterium]|nr:helix-turn-helix transcriptional regulator [Pseudonocardiaceae bacterium]